MTQHILLLDLKDDPQSIADYEAWHAPGKVPEAVVQSIRSHGVTAMQIFRSGNRLVMVVDVDPAFDPAATSATDPVDPEVEAWETRMDKFQQRLPWAAPGQKWVPARQIFDLEEQSQRAA